MPDKRKIPLLTRVLINATTAFSERKYDDPSIQKSKEFYSLLTNQYAETYGIMSRNLRSLQKEFKLAKERYDAELAKVPAQPATPIQQPATPIYVPPNSEQVIPTLTVPTAHTQPSAALETIVVSTPAVKTPTTNPINTESLTELKEKVKGAKYPAFVVADFSLEEPLRVTFFNDTVTTCFMLQLIEPAHGAVRRIYQKQPDNRYKPIEISQLT
ncbi:MAG: hypothetical protein O2779_02890 [Nanoarchaeota archaeon]|nr:hypothetical protein [Nanoarchaeota archaeon]